MSLLFATMLTRSMTELRITERLWQHEQAFHLAEAGIDAAIAAVRGSSLEWNDELLGTDSLAGTADDGILSFGASVPLQNGSYAARVHDNDDEAPPSPNNPVADTDGVIRVISTGTVQQSQRRIEGYLWAFFNHAIAAEVDVILRENSAMGNIHANRNIQVATTSVLVGASQATATGTFIFWPGETLIHTAGDLVGGDPPIRFLQPDANALEAAVDRWNAPNWNGTIGLLDQEIVGYRLGHDLTPNTIALSGAATLVVFDGRSITFTEKIGTFDQNGNCTSEVRVNIIALGGGSITLNERACLRGLIWAQGPVTIAERSTITGAVVSAGSTVTVGEKSQITFNRGVLNASLLAGFWGTTMLSWQEL
jgi:hypothetical protein